MNHSPFSILFIIIRYFVGFFSIFFRFLSIAFKHSILLIWRIRTMSIAKTVLSKALKVKFNLTASEIKESTQLLVFDWIYEFTRYPYLLAMNRSPSWRKLRIRLSMLIPKTELLRILFNPWLITIDATILFVCSDPCNTLQYFFLLLMNLFMIISIAESCTIPKYVTKSPEVRESSQEACVEISNAYVCRFYVFIRPLL